MKIKCRIANCGKIAANKSLCQMHAWRLKHHGDVFYTRPVTICIVHECGKKSKGHGLCSKHFNRKKRGSPIIGEYRTLNPKRYKVLTRPAHPISMRSGRIYEHRMVFYNSIGGGVVPCFWCAKPLFWHVDKKDHSFLVVDHLDHDRHNNKPTNLVPSCNSCNAGRMLISSKPRISQYSPGI